MGQVQTGCAYKVARFFDGLAAKVWNCHWLMSSGTVASALSGCVCKAGQDGYEKEQGNKGGG